ERRLAGDAFAEGAKELRLVLDDQHGGAVHVGLRGWLSPIMFPRLAGAPVRTAPACRPRKGNDARPKRKRPRIAARPSRVIWLPDQGSNLGPADYKCPEVSNRLGLSLRLGSRCRRAP